jgi:hypothetical protein
MTVDRNAIARELLEVDDNDVLRWKQTGRPAGRLRARNGTISISVEIDGEEYDAEDLRKLLKGRVSSVPPKGKEVLGGGTPSPPPGDFYSVAMSSAPPRGYYATARELLDDLPAIVMAVFGEKGARRVSNLVKRHSNGWQRRDRKWITAMAALAANGLSHSELPPDLKADFELIVLVAGAFDAVEKGQQP